MFRRVPDEQHPRDGTCRFWGGHSTGRRISGVMARPYPAVALPVARRSAASWRGGAARPGGPDEELANSSGGDGGGGLGGARGRRPAARRRTRPGAGGDDGPCPARQRARHLSWRVPVPHRRRRARLRRLRSRPWPPAPISCSCGPLRWATSSSPRPPRRRPQHPSGLFDVTVRVGAPPSSAAGPGRCRASRRPPPEP